MMKVVQTELVYPTFEQISDYLRLPIGVDEVVNRVLKERKITRENLIDIKIQQINMPDQENVITALLIFEEEISEDDTI